jgi:hypothetical protein
MKIVKEGNVLPSSTNPTRPFTRNTIDEHLDMVRLCTVSFLLTITGHGDNLRSFGSVFAAHGLSPFRPIYSRGCGGKLSSDIILLSPQLTDANP